MALTPTTSKELGFKAPSFLLQDTISGNNYSFNDLKGEKGTVVMFICNHCPFVVHVQDGLIQLANDYISKGFGFIAISSNDVSTHPQDGPDHMKQLGVTLDFPFAYLYDPTQEVAKAYDAACTPDFSIFNAKDECVYRGQLDDSRPGNDLPVTGNSIREVLDVMQQDGKVSADGQKPSIGCNIKWKS